MFLRMIGASEFPDHRKVHYFQIRYELREIFTSEWWKSSKRGKVTIYKGILFRISENSNFTAAQIFKGTPKNTSLTLKSNTLSIIIIALEVHF